MHSRKLGLLILSLFFCSGAAALVYEVVWSKHISHMVGSTVYAQTVVLAVFMGGLAIGNRLFGRLADRLKRPVVVYGILEIGIGAYALIFPMLYRLADVIFVNLGTSISDQSVLLLTLKGSLSAALLLGPTILMGGTLPLMASWLQRTTTDAGRGSARFYSVNSLGAVAGSWLAGFWLVAQYGIAATLFLTAGFNILLGTGAVILGRSSEVSRVLQPEEKEAKPKIAARGTLRFAGVIVAITGGVSMGLEVLAARSLAMIFGSSLQSFAIVLMAFILGIGLGSAWIASPKRKLRSSEGLIVLLLSMAAVWVVTLVFNIERWVEFYGIARTGLGRTEMGYVYNLLLNSAIALLIMGFPAAFIGAVLPLMIRAVSREGLFLGAHVGKLLTWNTIGAVVGVLSTGFVVMPLLGLRSAFGALALVLAAVALFMALRQRWRFALMGPAGACVLAVLLFFVGTEGWQYSMISGVFRESGPIYDTTSIELQKKYTDILLYEDAPDASVAVEHVGKRLVLTINGKPDASTAEADLCTQLLLAHLPMLVKPEAKDVFVLGLGSGITAGAMLGYPVDQVVVGENCAPVISSGRLFESWNRNVLDDPRVQMWLEDGRTVLKLNPQLYDVIITTPSNPWSVGIGSVFSQDYYEVVASRLKPGGFIAQWFQLYEMQDDIVETVLRTFGSVFPYFEIWDPGTGDIVLLGSMQPWETGPKVFQNSFEIERVRADMWMLDIRSPEALLARQLASQRTAFAIAGEGPIQRDMSPILEYAAPRALFLHQFSHVLEVFDERTYQQLLAPAEKRRVLGSLPAVEVQLILGGFTSVNPQLFNTVMGLPAVPPVPCVFQTPRAVPPPSSSGSVYDLATQAYAAGQLAQARQLIAYVLQGKPDDRQAAYLSRVFERSSATSPLQ